MEEIELVKELRKLKEMQIVYIFNKEEKIVTIDESATISLELPVCYSEDNTEKFENMILILNGELNKQFKEDFLSCDSRKINIRKVKLYFKDESVTEFESCDENCMAHIAFIPFTDEKTAAAITCGNYDPSDELSKHKNLIESEWKDD